jgi:adenosylcobinamide amidohydrolase
VNVNEVAGFGKSGNGTINVFVIVESQWSVNSVANILGLKT